MMSRQPLNRCNAPPGRYWQSIDSGNVQCTLCPHRCVIRPGNSGRCGVRANGSGKLSLPYFGHLSAINLDPIEKKPLYHFHPGKQVFSIGFLGCNLTCPFCQNYHISQSTAAKTTTRSPEEIVREAAHSGSFGIAYTYNEPSIHIEYILECCRLAHDAGLANVLVSNGHLLSSPAADLLDLTDAANIDLKGFQQDFYTREIGGHLEPVLEFLRLAAELCHLEVTTLLIPGKNDSREEIKSIAEYVASLRRDIPLHISAYYPTYKYNVAATTAGQVDEAMQVAKKSLDYVYPGNVTSDGSTSCPSCGSLLVRRRGYVTEVVGLESDAAQARCARCKTSIPIVLG